MNNLENKNTSDKPSLLIMVDWFYPGYKAGGPIRSCVNFVKAMESDFSISILTSDRDWGDKEPYQLKLDKWTSFSKSSSVYYISADRVSYSEIKNIVTNLKSDYIYLNSMYSIRFSLFPIYIFKSLKTSPKLILAPRGMLHKGAMNQKWIKKVIFLKMFSFFGFSKELSFHATDLQEKKDIQEYFGKETDIKVIPNFTNPIQKNWQQKTKKKGNLNLVFLSRISPKKNILFLLRVLSNVRTKVVLKIYGNIEDAKYWNACKNLISELNENIKVSYEGVVSNDRVEEVLLSQHLFVLPTLGENFGHSIFEALASGTPVLISDQTPWKELSADKAGWEWPLSNLNQFTDTIEKVASMDQSDYDLWSKGAYDFAKAQQKIPTLKRKYQQLFTQTYS